MQRQRFIDSLSLPFPVDILKYSPGGNLGNTIFVQKVPYRIRDHDWCCSPTFVWVHFSSQFVSKGSRMLSSTNTNTLHRSNATSILPQTSYSYFTCCLRFYRTFSGEGRVLSFFSDDKSKIDIGEQVSTGIQGKKDIVSPAVSPGSWRPVQIFSNSFSNYDLWYPRWHQLFILPRRHTKCA